MTEIQAQHWNAAPTASAPTGISALPTAQGVTVEVADEARLDDVWAAWTDLLSRADAPNVFMDPTLIRLAGEIEPQAQHRALLAWKHIGGLKQLVGVWGFSVGRVRKSALPKQVITIPPHVHSHLATPVIDRDCLDQALDAMLDGIANDPTLPSIIAIDGMASDGLTFAALQRVIESRGSALRIFQQYRRPKLQSDRDGKSYLEQAVSSSSRKKLRQHRRRLSEKGALTSTVLSTPSDVKRAIEEFLAIEAAGWKGREGTALLCNDSHAAFIRGAVAALAEHGCASIHALYLDRKAVSMQVVARAGAGAFTWKTTYDEQFRDFSPGMLLLEDYTAAFLADKSIAFVDSCAIDETSFMAAWSERQAMADLWIDARRGGSFEFRVLSGLQGNYRDLRAAAKSAYLALRKSRQR